MLTVIHFGGWDDRDVRHKEMLEADLLGLKRPLLCSL